MTIRVIDKTQINLKFKKKKNLNVISGLQVIRLVPSYVSMGFG